MGAFLFFPEVPMERDYVTVAELEHMLATGLRVFLRSGVEVRRVLVTPSPATKEPK